MDTQTIIAWIYEWSYLAVFLIYAVGLFVFPVPNEVLLMTGGALATTYLLDPLPAFIIIYLSVMFHGTFLYVLGRKGGRPLLLKVKKRSSFIDKVEKGEAFLNKYGLKAAAFGYYLPFLRHATPFSVGMSAYRYVQYSLVAFPSAFLWVSLYFLLGYYFSEYTSVIGRYIEAYGMLVVLALLLVVVCVSLLRILRNRRRKNQEDH